MSKQKNKQNPSLPTGSMPLRALIATFFTLFLAFTAAVVAYTWGYVHGILSADVQVTSSAAPSATSPSVTVSEPKVDNAVLYERSGTVTAISGETLTLVTAGKKTFTAQVTVDTEYTRSTSDESGTTSTELAAAADIHIGDVIRVFSDTNIASVSTFTATRIEKSS